MARRTRLLLWATIAALVVEVGGATGAKPGAAISTPPPFALTTWKAAGDNVAAARGTIMLNGAPVSGVRVRVDAFDLRAPTDALGHFVYLVDDTRLARHVIAVVDTGAARVGSRPLTKDERSALAAERAAITVAYAVHDLRVSRDRNGRPVVSGRSIMRSSIHSSSSIGSTKPKSITPKRPSSMNRKLPG